MNTVYVVGKVNPENHLEWEIQGVYESESDAVDSCMDYYFVGPIPMNKPLPDDTQEWEGCYYPTMGE